MSKTLRGCLLGAALMVSARGAVAQRAPTDTAQCDSIVAAARVDSVAAALYIGIKRSDGGEIAPAQVEDMITAVALHFEAPRPFRMSVFDGPALTRLLRAIGGSHTELRAPTLTGVYRFTSDQDGIIYRRAVVRRSLVAGLDTAMMVAIREAVVTRSVFVAADDDDSMMVDVRISTDSVDGSRRMIAATLPRMPVIDAVPFATNPAPRFPQSALAAGQTAGEVVLRFVVGRDGVPIDDTVELVRGTSAEFVRAAMIEFPHQRFRPAVIDGCGVPQQVTYSFSFIAPTTH